MMGGRAMMGALYGYVAVAVIVALYREWRRAKDAKQFDSFRKAFALPAVTPDPEDKINAG